MEITVPLKQRVVPAYIVCHDWDDDYAAVLESLQLKVASHMFHGYVPTGGVSVVLLEPPCRRFYAAQAMVMKD